MTPPTSLRVLYILLFLIDWTPTDPQRTPLQPHNAVLDLLSTWAAYVADPDSTDGRTACLHLPASVEDAVLTPLLLPLNLSRWFLARSNNSVCGFNVSTFLWRPQSGVRSITHYTWPSWFNFSSLATNECTKQIFFNSRPGARAMSIPCSTIPWGSNPRIDGQARRDGSLIWDPLSALVAPTPAISCPLP